MDSEAFEPPPAPSTLTVEGWLEAVPPEASPYWRAVRKMAHWLKSDGCTGVPDFYRDACFEHDVHWRTGRTINGVPITTAQANRRFRLVIQARSPLGRWSPLSWWRWVGVTAGGFFIRHKSA